MAFKVWVRKERSRALCHIAIEHSDRTAFKYVGNRRNLDDSEWLPKGHHLWHNDVLTEMYEYGEVECINDVYNVSEMLKLME